MIAVRCRGCSPRRPTRTRCRAKGSRPGTSRAPRRPRRRTLGESREPRLRSDRLLLLEVFDQVAQRGLGSGAAGVGIAAATSRAACSNSPASARAAAKTMTRRKSGPACGRRTLRDELDRAPSIANRRVRVRGEQPREVPDQRRRPGGGHRPLVGRDRVLGPAGRRPAPSRASATRRSSRSSSATNFSNASTASSAAARTPRGASRAGTMCRGARARSADQRETPHRLVAAG